MEEAEAILEAVKCTQKCKQDMAHSRVKLTEVRLVSSSGFLHGVLLGVKGVRTCSFGPSWVIGEYRPGNCKTVFGKGLGDKDEFWTC